MLTIENKITAAGDELLVTGSEDGQETFIAGQARLDLYTPSGEHVRSMPNVTGRPLRFPLTAVEPGMYTADVTLSGTDLRLVDMVLVADANYDKRFDQFQAALDLHVEAESSTSSDKVEVLRGIQTTYAYLGLADLSEEIGVSLRADQHSSPIHIESDSAGWKGAGVIKIRLYRSPIATPEKHKAIVRALGLKKLNRIVERPDTPAFRGMVDKVPHLLEIVE